MICAVCRFPDTRVVDSRTSGDGIRRRRGCLQCGHRFTTHERVEQRLPLVVKKDGSRVPYDSDKVVAGLRHAARKRPITAEQLEEAARRVEAVLLASGVAEVPSVEIGRVVLAELKGLDMVAYMRFASVYLEFESPEQFLSVLEQAPSDSLLPEDEIG